MKFIIYSVCYDKTEPGEGVRIYNVKKVAEFAERSEAFIACEGLNEYHKKKAEQYPLAAGVGFFYGWTEKAGSWKEQAGALERAAKNCGICAIR